MTLRTSVIARLIVMGILMTLLLIPLAMIESVVTERAGRRSEVAQSVSTTWGGAQTIAGPVLVVPYRCTTTDLHGRQTQTINRTTFLPEILDVQGVADTEIRARTLFKVVVYKARLKLSGRFARPDMSGVARAGSEPLWNEATVNIGVTDPRGIARGMTLKWNGQDIALAPGIRDAALFETGVHASARFSADGPAATIPFALDLDLNGTRDFRLLPAGSETSLQLTSTWPHPGFTGAALPDSRTVTDQGFSASWHVPYFGRGFPPAWTDASLDRDRLKTQAEAASFGVSFVQPVDIYQQSERAVKYAALFIVLTFVVFFLSEVLRARLLHPVQYVFVGFAICVFYLLLVSISEHVGFDRAYAVAATATTLLIGTYSAFVLGGTKEGVFIGAAVAALYSFLYMLLRLEEYALLAGSIGLFAMLALLMLATRRVNWYELRLGAPDTRDALSGD
jgi:inner membrane protein